MYGRNLALLHQAPLHTSNKVTEELSNEGLKQLIQDVESMLDDSVRDAFSTDMLRHVGDQANYELKAQALQSLKLVADKLHDTDTEDSEKTIIALKLQERAENCTAGFHNGINEIVEGFYMADNLPDLLFRVRQDIVSRVATTLTEDTHANNHIFAMAEDLNYGVRATNREDIYINTNRLPNNIIEEKLKEAFKKNLGLFGMLQGVEDQLKGQLMSLGYEGGQSQGYKPATVDKLLDYFMRLFKDTDTVNNYTIAKTDLESTRKIAEEARAKAESSIEALLEKHKIPLESHKSSKIKALLGDKSVLNLSFIRIFLETLPSNLLDSDDLKKIRNTLKEESEVTPANKKYSEHNQALHKKFFIGENGIVTDVNWPEIKQLIWHQVRDQQYFKFREANEELTGAEKLMEEITDPNSQSLDNLKDFFCYLINDIDEFTFAKQYLPPEQQRVLHEIFDEVLPGMIASISDFNKAMLCYEPQEQIKLYHDLEQDLIKKIDNVEDLSMLFKHLDLECQNSLFTATKDLRKNLIHDRVSMFKLAKNLDSKIIGYLYAENMPILLNLIDNKRSFEAVIQMLPPEFQSQFLEASQELLPKIFKSGRALSELVNILSPEMQVKLFEVSKAFLPEIIQSSRDFGRLIYEASPEAQLECFEIARAATANIMTNGQAFRIILSAFSLENQPQFLESMKNELPNILRSMDDVGHAIGFRVLERSALFFDAIKKHIPSLINNTEDLKQVFSYYPPEFQINFLKTQKDKLLEIITDVSSFKYALYVFPRENYPLLIEQLGHQLPHIINNKSDFTRVIRSLSKENKIYFLEAIKEHIPKIITTVEGFLNAISSLSPENQPYFIELMKEHLPHIINTNDDIKQAILGIRSKTNRTFFIEAISELLPIIIQNKEDLQDVLYGLPDDIRDQIVDASSTNEENRQKFSAMKDELNQIKNDDDDSDYSGHYMMDDDDIFPFSDDDEDNKLNDGMNSKSP